MSGSIVTRRTFLRASALAAAGMVVGLAGCAPSRSTEGNSFSASSSSSVASVSASASAVSAGSSNQSSGPANESARKPLVVYFSYTGNVDAMAHWIADEVGGDLVRVTAKEAYPDDYDATVDRAKDEQDQNARPEIVVDLNAERLANCDTVFFGFPIWWYDLPMPMCTFLEDYDLSGKTVIPFFSHGGSSSGANSLPTLESLAKGATVKSGDAISILGDNVAASEQDVRAWAKGKTGLGTTGASTIAMKVGGTTLTMLPANTEAASALVASLRDAPISVDMHSYGGFEKVGALPNELPSSDEQITTQPGDVMLYQGNQITVFHGSNTWAYTPLGHLEGATTESLLAAFGEGDATVELALQ